jgi:hypothetical protein
MIIFLFLLCFKNAINSTVKVYQSKYYFLLKFLDFTQWISLNFLQKELLNNIH